MDITLLQPWAILANGPPWIKAGVPSKVWTRFGKKASFNKAVRAPSSFKSWAVIGLPSLSRPSNKLPSLFFKSSREDARQNSVIISLADVIA